MGPGVKSTPVARDGCGAECVGGRSFIWGGAVEHAGFRRLATVAWLLPQTTIVFLHIFLLSVRASVVWWEPEPGHALCIR
jgi:hypothetical protein